MLSFLTTRHRLLQTLAVCSLFLGRVFPAGALDSEDEALRHFAAGQQAQRAGQMNEAAREYQKVVQLLPDAAEAYASLGLVYHAQRKYTESLQALSKAEDLKPGLPGVSLYLGIDHVKLHESGAALANLRRAVKDEPGNAQAYTWLSEAYSDHGMLDAAIDALRKAVSLAPADPALLLDLSRLYRRAAAQQITAVLKSAPSASPMHHQVFGDIYKDEHVWQNARAHYFKALEEDPAWRGAHLAIAEIALVNQDLVNAEMEARNELRIAPRSAAALALLGEIALLEDHVGNALNYFQQATRLAPWEAAHAVGLPGRGSMERTEPSFEAQGRLRKILAVLTDSPASVGRDLAMAVLDKRLGSDDALAHAWERFVAASPTAGSLNLYDRAVLSFDRAQPGPAASELHTWLISHPADLQAAYLLAQVDQALSREALEKLLTTSPESYPSHQALAELSRENGDNEKALQEYAIAEKLAPDLAGLHLAVGSLLLEMHRDDAALMELKAELAIDPLNAEANHEAGEIYLHLQNTAEAIPCLERAVQQAPGLWSARQQLGQAYYSQKQFAKAASVLQAALVEDPDGSAHFQLGLAYRALGETEKAREQFEQSRALKLQSLSHDQTELATFQKLTQ